MLPPSYGGSGSGHSNGSNCSAGQAALGVDASGNAEGCWTPGGGGFTAIYDCTTGDSSPLFDFTYIISEPPLIGLVIISVIKRLYWFNNSSILLIEK